MAVFTSIIFGICAVGSFLIGTSSIVIQVVGFWHRISRWWRRCWGHCILQIPLSGNEDIFYKICEHIEQIYDIKKLTSSTHMHYTDQLTNLRKTVTVPGVNQCIYNEPSKEAKNADASLTNAYLYMYFYGVGSPEITNMIEFEYKKEWVKHVHNSLKPIYISAGICLSSIKKVLHSATFTEEEITIINERNKAEKDAAERNLLDIMASHRTQNAQMLNYANRIGDHVPEQESS